MRTLRVLLVIAGLSLARAVCPYSKLTLDVSVSGRSTALDASASTVDTLAASADPQVDETIAEVSVLEGTPKFPSVGGAKLAATYTKVVPKAPEGVNPSAWCPIPTFWVGGNQEDFSSCVLLLDGNEQCSISWIFTPDTKTNIAISAAHCFSSGGGKWIADLAKIQICCAWDGVSNGCPATATYPITEVRVLNTYHLAAKPAVGASDDIAIVATTASLTGKNPKKWRVNNWNPTAKTMKYWVYGYPALQGKNEGCNADVLGSKTPRRLVYGVFGPVLAQPTAAASATLLGNSCGGNSGGPILDSDRAGITSILSAANFACNPSGKYPGYGEINVAAIRGVPAKYGGKPGVTNPKAAVDIWCLKAGL